MSKTEFINLLRSFEPSRDEYTKFQDFLTLSYCAFAKPQAPEEQAEALETQYMNIVKQYSNKDDIRQMPKLLAYVFEAVHQEQDFLGEIASEQGFLSDDKGQFFTPYHISKLMAEISIGNAAISIEEKGYITISDPCVGAGCMILAAADILTEQNIDISSSMWVDATDISPLAHKMCFIQLCARGVPAIVRYADTLRMEEFGYALTPIVPHFFAKHGDPHKRQTTDPDNSPDITLSPSYQPSLFD